ncbi:MAG: cytochrome c, partial [Acidobacteriota bacterium]
GVSPKGEHYYPVFPYTSYQRMRERDLLDLKAFLGTLPAVKSQVLEHDLALPFRLRQTLALWKWMFLDGKTFKPDPNKSAKLNRGAYLVEGPGHCGECHSPRNLLGGVITHKRFSGGPDPAGKGVVPNITPHKSGIADWSEADIVTALETGLTPEFDTFTGNMVKVQENMAELSAQDRLAIAAYVKSLTPIPSSVGKSKKP